MEFETDFINTNEISGIFSSQSMEEFNRRKNGQWKCSYNFWHEKFEKCDCKNKCGICGEIVKGWSCDSVEYTELKLNKK